MPWIVKLTSPDGSVFYGEAMDHEGSRYRCHSPDYAEVFQTKYDAEFSFFSFRAMRELQEYNLEAVELESLKELLEK